jgi:hypothetical protein
VADKYEMAELKEYCVQTLGSTLSRQGWKKPSEKKKPAQWVFLVVFGLFGVFLGFLGFCLFCSQKICFKEKSLYYFYKKI